MAPPAAPCCPKARVLWWLYLVPMCRPQLPSRHLVERYEIELGHKVALTKRINGCDVARTDETEAQHENNYTLLRQMDETTEI